MTNCSDAPYRRIGGHQHSDALNGKTVGSKQDREQSPGQTEVEVVDQPRLAGRRQRRFGEAGAEKDLPVGEPDVGMAVTVLAGFKLGMPAGLAHESRGESDGDECVRQAE